MAYTISNAIKTLLENAGLGVSAYRDGHEPDDDEPRYITISEGISVSQDVDGDGGAFATVIEEVQVDVWEPWQDEDGNVIESPDLAHEVQRTLHGAQLVTAPMRVYRVQAPFRRRLLEEQSNVVHNAITATVKRHL